MLKNLLRRLKPASSVPTLPQTLQESLTRRDTAPVVAWLRQALERNPNTPELPLLLDATRNAGWQAHDVNKLAVVASYGAGRWAQALTHAQAHIHDDEHFDADIFVMACNALYYVCRFEEAWRLIENLGGRETTLAGRADFALAAALIAQANDRMAEMKQWIDLARALAPDDTTTAFNALLMNFELGDQAALEELEQAIAQGRYASVMTELVRATLALAREDYAEGFRLFEARYQMSDARRYLNGALFEWPRWQGEALAGRTLLVSAEQGLGDTVMMARFLPLLQEKGAGPVVVEVQAEAVPLLQASYPELTVIERQMNAVPIGLTFDLWTGMMSLPHLLGTTVESIPGRAGYLCAPQENRHYWRQRLAELAPANQPRIGLAFSGQRLNRADRRRSLPIDRLFARLAACPASFFALQKEVPAVHPANLHDVADELVSLADTAALIGELDLVISICSCPAHLAGSLGQPTWLLLPKNWEWRWGHHGEANHWYDSVKVIRQSRHGDWDEVLQEVFAVRLPAWTAQRES